MNPFYSGRIPQDLNRKAIAYCEEKGVSKTRLLIMALEFFISNDQKQGDLAVRLKKMASNQKYIAKTIWQSNPNLSPLQKEELQSIADQNDFES